MFNFRAQKDNDASRISADEKQVLQVIDTIGEMVDPFQDDPEENDLVNLSSGVVASDDIVADLAGAFNKGNEVFEHFVSNKLLVEEPDIFHPIAKQKLKTFTSTKKAVSRLTSKGQIVSLKSNCIPILFRWQQLLETFAKQQSRSHYRCSTPSFSIAS